MAIQVRLECQYDILKDESNIMSIALRSAEMKGKVREQGMFYSGHVKEVLC